MPPCGSTPAFGARADVDPGERVRLLVESGESLKRPEASQRGDGEPPGCSGCALGCVEATRATRRADGAVSSNRAQATCDQRVCVSWRAAARASKVGVVPRGGAREQRRRPVGRQGDVAAARHAVRAA